MKKIGVYRYSALGDIAAALPVLRAFQTPPTILTSPIGYELLRDEFQEFIILPSKSPLSLLTFIARVRKQIDLFIDLQSNDRSRFIGLFLKERVGNEGVKREQSVTEIFHQIAAKSGLVGPLDREFHPKEPSYIVLNMGSSPSWLSKRLPPEKWVEFSRILTDRFQLPFLLTGSGDEVDYIRGIAPKLAGRVEVVAGKTTIGELKHILREAFLVVSTDSAPMHIAAVQKTPTIGLFGATNWTISAPFGPWSTALYDPSLFPDGRPPAKNRREVGNYYDGIDITEGLRRLAPYLNTPDNRSSPEDRLR
ncbi:MAG: glycosyltransferase family 9 protein [Epsilonproteobacteria bacterium]|nr:hypothetical protein [Campylobacterota bacterium]NPA57426.1 glycosyltransferase family 9 protein [Campylobacterota bacterium]